MCIIVSKEKNKKIPSRQILENCFNSNPDGAGFMYTLNHRVIIEKGFFTFDEFYNRLMEVDDALNLQKKSLVMHFRIGTSGGYTAGVCHPFPVTNNVDELQKTETNSKLAMVHNGVISNYTFGKLSDTQNFVKDFVYPLSKINCNFLNNKNAINLLYQQSAATKLCFLDRNDNITYVGNFITDKGIKYSNSSYKDYVWTPSYKNVKYYN
jgi:predicted glutamine amidotransferase